MTLDKNIIAKNDKRSRVLWVIILIFFSLSIGLVWVGYFYYENQKERYKKQIAHQLTAIANLKARDISRWIKERLADANVLYKNIAFENLVRNYLKNPHDMNFRQEILNWLGNIQTSYDYERVLLLDSQGKLQIAIPGNKTPVCSLGKEKALEALRSRQIVFLDIHQDETTQEAHLGIIIPVLNRQDGGNHVGVVILIIDPKHYLYPFLQRWPTTSKTAETLIVRREGNYAVFLNELKFLKNAPLIPRIPLEKTSIPAVQAVLGYRGIIEGIDYRGMPVLAAVRAIPDSPWALVARQDLAEVYAPLRERLWITIMVVGLLLIGSGLGVGLAWRQQAVSFYREKYKAAEQLRQEEEKAQQYLNIVETIVLALNPDQTVGMINQAGCRILGYKEAEILGKNWFEHFLDQETRKDAEKVFAQLMAGIIEPVEYVENQVKTRSGQLRIVAWHNALIRDEMGHIAGTLSSGEDITERKQAEERLVIQSRIADIFLKVPDDMMYHEVLKVVLEMMQSPYGVFGYIDKNGGLVVPSMTRHIWDKCQVAAKTFSFPRDTWGHSAWPQAIREKRVVYSNEVSTQIPEGHVMILRHISFPILFEGEVIGLLQVANKETAYTDADIRLFESIAGHIAPILSARLQRQWAEASLRESEKKLRWAEQMVHLGHWSYDLQTGLTFWSDEMYRIYGIPPQAITFEEILNFYLPEERPYQRWIVETIKSEGTCDFEHLLRRTDGELRYVTGNGQIVLDESGEAVSMFGTLLDITELKEKEKELEERNAELNRFIYAVSHDLRSPLVTIKTFLGYLEQDQSGADTKRVEQDMHFLHTAADKMGQLLDELLEMSRVGRLTNPSVQVTFQEVVQESVNLVAGLLSSRGVEVQISEVEVTLYGDRPRLVEIFQNLVENAVKFMGEQEHPRIEIGVDSGSHEKVFFVRDNGSGVDPRYQSKVFGLFEKLDPRSEGTGMGLAIVKRIIELYEGKIWIESGGSGQGATFFFTLPKAVKDQIMKN